MTRGSFKRDNPAYRLAASSLRFLRNDSCIVQGCSTGSVQGPARRITEPITRPPSHPGRQSDSAAARPRRPCRRVTGGSAVTGDSCDSNSGGSSAALIPGQPLPTFCGSLARRRQYGSTTLKRDADIEQKGLAVTDQAFDDRAHIMRSTMSSPVGSSPALRCTATSPPGLDSAMARNLHKLCQPAMQVWSAEVEIKRMCEGIRLRWLEHRSYCKGKGSARNGAVVLRK